MLARDHPAVDEDGAAALLAHVDGRVDNLELIFVIKYYFEFFQVCKVVLYQDTVSVEPGLKPFCGSV